MYNGLLHLHSFMRWVILLLLVINIIRLFSGNNSINLSKWLLISAHITLLVGLYQWAFGPTWGLNSIMTRGFGEVMKDPVARFFAVEHISGMLIAIALITIGHVSLKKTGNTKKTAILYTIALIIILAVVPWPFRELIGSGRTWFPGMH